MAACPHCRFANPDAAAACARCGRDLVAAAGAGLPAPLPAPMVEPIDPPSKPPDSSPLPSRPALTVSLGEASSVVTSPIGPGPSEPTPAPVTVRDLALTEPPCGRHAPGGTSPAHPGLPGHPMNDAVLQSPPQTVPATEPSDQQPQSVPPAPVLHPKLVVLRGLKINAEYPVYEGRNTIGRFADKPVDIDLMNQESVEQIWCSRQHAVVIYDKGLVGIEDLNSLNGTWVNGARIHPGQQRQLKPGDVVQIGTVQMKLVFA